MASAAYSIQVDFDRDSTYAHASSDITQYVTQMSWNNGMGKPDLDFATPARLTLTLTNQKGDFNLEEAAAAFFGLFARGQLVRVRATFAATTYTLFIGKLQTVPNIDPATFGTHTVVLSVTDLMYDLLRAEFVPDLLTSVTTDVALQQVFNKAVVALPYTSDYWILSNATNSVLSSTTRLVNTAVGVNFETGKTTLAYIGDNTGGDNTTRAQTYLRDVVAAEAGGRFWFDGRTGKFVFHNRHHDINPTVAVTLAGDDYDDAKYVAQTEVFNRVTVHYSPREVGAVGTVLWAHESTLELANGQSKTITARYRDVTDNSAKVGALVTIPIATGTDMIANTASDGSGTAVSTKISVSALPGGGQAVITISNNSGATAHVTTLQIRGTPLKSFQRQSVTLTDGDSFRLYDVGEKNITLNAVDSRDLAESMAQQWVQRYKSPLSVYEAVMFTANNSDERMTNALTRGIGDAITVQFSDISHDQDYVIVGESHRVTGGGDYPHEVTWVLAPNKRQRYWILSDAVLSLLSDTTILAF